MSKYITSTPGIMSGDPVIAGTRIPISRIIYLLSQGVFDNPKIGHPNIWGIVPA